MVTNEQPAEPKDIWTTPLIAPQCLNCLWRVVSHKNCSGDVSPGALFPWCQFVLAREMVARLAAPTIRLLFKACLNKLVNWTNSPELLYAPDPFLVLPFGHGPRGCIGRKLAEDSLLMLLIHLFAKFRLLFTLNHVPLLSSMMLMLISQFFNFHSGHGTTVAHSINATFQTLTKVAQQTNKNQMSLAVCWCKY